MSVFKIDGSGRQYAVPGLGSTVPLFDHYTDVGNVGTGEDDLYSDTIPAGQLAANGDKIRAHYAGLFVSHASRTRAIRGYFGGTSFFDSGPYVTDSATSGQATPGFVFDVEIIRVSATVVRIGVLAGIPPITALGPLPVLGGGYTEITGLTLANTNVLKITGECSAGSSNNDITAKSGSVVYIPAA